MKIKTAVLTIGLPGSSKSTLTNRLAARNPKQYHVVHVEDYLDANREHCRDRYGNAGLWHGTWPRFWNHLRDVGQQRRGVLLLDMWLYNLEWRAEVTRALRNIGITELIAWEFLTDPDICRERYIAREFERDPQWMGTEWKTRSSLKWHWDCLHCRFVPMGEEDRLLFDDILQINAS